MTVACLGKIPTHGDFVRVQVGTAALRSFDGWMRTGLRRGRKRSRFSVPGGGPTRRFVFGGGEEAVLVGALRMSRDEQGRRYPFSVVCELSGRRGTPPHRVYLPVQCAAFFDEATSLIRQAVAGEVGRDGLRRGLGRLPHLHPTPTVPRQHKRFLRRRTVGDLGDALARRTADRGDGVRSLVHVVSGPLQRIANPLAQGLRWPLPDEGQPPGSFVSFWTAIALQRASGGSSAPALFWTDPASTESPSDLLMYEDPAPPDALDDVLRPVGRAGADGPLDLVQARTGPGGSPGGRLREEERLWEFLHRP